MKAHTKKTKIEKTVRTLEELQKLPIYEILDKDFLKEVQKPKVSISASGEATPLTEEQKLHNLLIGLENQIIISLSELYSKKEKFEKTPSEMFFYAGPVENIGDTYYLHDLLTIHDWMKTEGEEIANKHGLELEVGLEDNYHVCRRKDGKELRDIDKTIFIEDLKEKLSAAIKEDDLRKAILMR